MMLLLDRRLHTNNEHRRCIQNKHYGAHQPSRQETNLLLTLQVFNQNGKSLIFTDGRRQFVLEFLLPERQFIK